GAVLGILLIAGYGLFNMTMSGGFFPNPVAAKLKYYAAASSDYWGDTLRFYTSSAHAALVAFACIGVVALLWGILHRRLQPVFMAVAYIAGTLLAGWLIFPFVLSMHTLFATIPFFLLLSLWGIRALWLGLTSVWRSSSGKLVATSIALNTV